jgi:hypothetical protein
MTPQERLEHRSWRKTAMSASLFDPMSARYALKKSCDDMAVLGECGLYARSSAHERLGTCLVQSDVILFF